MLIYSEKEAGNHQCLQFPARKCVGLKCLSWIRRNECNIDEGYCKLDKPKKVKKKK